MSEHQQQHVFISYSRHNTDTLERVSFALTEAHIPVWTDKTLTAGTSSWKNAIEEAIQSAACIVVLMSPTAKSSQWVERELDYAYVLQRPIYPCLVEGSQRDAVPFELINMQYIDARTDFEHAMFQLTTLIRPLFTTEAPVEIEDAAIRMGISLDQSSESTTMQPVMWDALMYLLGFKRDDDRLIRQYLTSARRLLRWYFLEPRKYRLASLLVSSATLRQLHASLTFMNFFWILGIASFCWTVSQPSAFLRQTGTEMIYVIIGLVYCLWSAANLPTQHKTQGGLGVSILYASLLMGGMAVVFIVSWLILIAFLQVFNRGVS